MTGIGNQKVIALDEVNSLVTGRHGLYLANKFDVYIGCALIKYGEYCESEWRTLSQLVKPGFTVVEVGANVGSHSVSLAKTVGPSGRVIAIEPQRIIHQYLCANLSLNALGNVETHCVGCGAQPGRLVVPPIDYFAHRPQNFGGIPLSPGGSGDAVPVVRLDDVLQGRPAHLLKIDVEGMEAQVLQGAARLIGERRPFIYLENDRMDRSDALISLLWSMNYRLFWDIPRLFNPRNYFAETENIYGATCSFNMLCVPRESPVGVQDFAEVTTLGAHPLKT